MLFPFPHTFFPSTQEDSQRRAANNHEALQAELSILRIYTPRAQLDPKVTV